MLSGILTYTGGLAYTDGEKHNEKNKAKMRNKNTFTLKRGKKFAVKVVNPP